MAAEGRIGGEIERESDDDVLARDARASLTERAAFESRAAAAAALLPSLPSSSPPTPTQPCAGFADFEERERERVRKRWRRGERERARGAAISNAMQERCLSRTRSGEPLCAACLLGS